MVSGMKLFKKKIMVMAFAVMALCGLAIAQGVPAGTTAQAASVAVNYNFTDTMEGAAFKAPASNYGWKVTKGALSPDNAMTENNQIGYLAQAIALNENKYISMDFYATNCPFDIMLLPYAETVNPWSKDGVGVHCMAGGWLRLDTYIDANEGWLADYTGIGSGADGYAHKLEIISDGTNLTFKVDGADAFAGTTVAIPADSVQLVLRAAKGSYIDNLYIADSQPIEVTATELDFTDKLDLSDFTAMALDGWTGGNGKYHPVQEGGLYNASATKYNKLLDLTGKQYISFDFYSTAATFDVGLLDGNSENLWGNGLFIHMPFSDGTIGINNYVDCTQGTYYDGLSINVVDGQAHTLEIFVENGKVSYALDGNLMTGNGGTTQFDAPADTAYLVFRAVGTASYIDNLYVGESAPAVKGFDFESSCDGNAFTAWESEGWNVVDGGFTAKSNWACTQMLTPLDLTKNQDITFDVYLSSADAEKQFNVGFFPDANPENAHTPNAGVTYSLGSTLFLGSSFDRNHWIADVGAVLYNDTWHSVKISVENAKLSIAVDGVAYDALTADIPAETAYLLLQSTNTANVLDNLAFHEIISYTLTVKDIAGNTLDCVETTGDYVLPERVNIGSQQLVGYAYNEKIYQVGDVISVTDNGELTALIVDFTMHDGGSIRLHAPTGMRFTSQFDETAYEYFTAMEIAEWGTLIAKDSDVVGDGDYAELYCENAYTHLEIASTVGSRKDGYYEYRGVLAEIKPEHYEWLFAARGYMTVTYSDGSQNTFYTNVVTRSVKAVAELAYYDRSETMVEDGAERYPYLTADGDYSPYIKEYLELLHSFTVKNAIYVSVSGDDAFDGKLRSKAVATLERAVELAQENAESVIILCDGEYTLSQTVAIGSNITVRSLNRNGATISGATAVAKERITERIDAKLGRVWEIPYAEKINQLYINDSYGVRARYPDAGQELRLFNADETLRTLSVFTEDIQDFSALDLVDSVIVPSIQWAESYLRIKSVTEKTLATGLALTDIRLYDADSIIFSRALAISPRTSYHFENSKAFLNARGEWYYDETAKKIYYLPYDNETVENTTIRIPATQTLLQLKGEAGAKVSNVTFSGVNFMYTKNGVIDGKIGGQANRYDSFQYTNIAGLRNGRTFAAIEGEFIDNILFENNVFACMGGGALDFLQGASNVSIHGNVFRTIGGNGVLVGTLNTDAKVMEKAYEADNNVINTAIHTINNYFTEIGWQEYGSCAVAYTYASNSKINQNTINNVAYTGISLGWGWEYLSAGAYLENNEIINNRITNVMTFMNDGGGIYLVGCQPNTRVAGNYIADFYNGVYKYPADLRDNEQTEQYWWANAGIYLDTAAGSNEESTKVIVEGNYIAEDIENQKYEFCNVVKAPNQSAHDKYYFSIDGKTGEDDLSIYMSNGITAEDVAAAGASVSAQRFGTILFGAHMVDKNTLTVFGAGFGASYNGTLTVNGTTVAEKDVMAWTDEKITFRTTDYAGCSANIKIGDSNRLYTAMNVDERAELARFDGYIDVKNVSTWYKKLDVVTQKISSVTVSEAEDTKGYVNDGLYYTVWETDGTSANAFLTCTLAKASTMDTFILYDRIESNMEEAEYRKNIRIVGLTASGEVLLYESGNTQAYTNFGMLTLDMEELGFADITFTGFRIEKVGGGAFAIADIAVI